jgi:alpha-tubulin suppressor-like RCC1 family protein
LLNNGSVKCWGRNYYGQLGKGTKGNTAHIGDDANEMGDNLTSIDLGTDRTATAISVGSQHTCALLDNASVKCWGRNFYGQLGKGNNDALGNDANEMGDNLTSINLGTDRTATAISLGAHYTCALLDNASVKCWGNGSNGQLGQGNNANLGNQPSEQGDNLPSINLGTDRTATAISAGAATTCALLDNASVKCWGRGSYGHTGQGNTDDIGDDANEMGDNLPSIDLGTGRTATAISAVNEHTCALLDNASVKCWGRNNFGQLGQGNTDDIGDNANEMGDNLTSIDLGTGRTATAIATGYQHTCALLDNASVKCWGRGKFGPIGHGNNATWGNGANEMGDNLPSTDLGTGRTATAISAGQFHTCAILDDASVKCWGFNTYGQLGQGNKTQLGAAVNEMGDNLPAIDL